MKKLLLLVLVLGLASFVWADTRTDVGAPDRSASELQPPPPPGINTITWTTKAPTSPIASRLAAAEVNGKIYRIGGETTGGSRLGWVQEFDPTGNAWTNKASMPTPASNITCAVWNNAIYVPGGYDGANALTSLQIYYPQGDSWTTGTALPLGLFGQAAAVVGDILYVIGGTDAAGTYYANTYAYDLVAKTWSTKAPMPGGGRGYFAAGAVNGKIYAVGGRNATTADFTTCEEYDPAANSWAAKAGMGTGRGGVGVAAIGNRIYACGGGWSSYYSSVEWYNPGSNAWTTDTPFTTGRRTVGVCADGNTLYVVGGWAGAYLGNNEEGVTDAVGVEIRNPINPEIGASLLARPNPSRGRATIEYSLPAKAGASLKVYDAMGRLVRTLVSGTQEAGFHSVTLEGTGLSSGVYFCTLQAGSFSATRKLVIAR